MDNELKFIVQGILEADEKASADRITKQLPNIEKAINAKSKIKIHIDVDSKSMDTSKIQSDLEQQTKKLSKNIPKIEISKSFIFDTSNMQSLYSQLDSYVKKLNSKIGFSQAKYNITTGPTGQIDTTTITYYNDALKQTVAETYRLDAANEASAGSMSRMYLAATKYTSNLQAAATATQKLSNLQRSLELDAKKLKTQAGENSTLDWAKYNQAFDSGNFEKARTELSLLRKELSALNAAVPKDFAELAIEKLESGIKKAESSLSSLEHQLVRLGNYAPQGLKDQVQSLSSSLSNLEILPDTEEKIQQFRQISLAIDKIKASVRQLTEQRNTDNWKNSFDRVSINIDKARERLLLFKNNYGSLTKDPELLANWQNLFDSAGMVKSQSELTKLNAQISLFEKQVESAGKKSKTLWSELSANAKKFFNWFMIGGVVASGVRQITDAFKTFKEIDTYLTEISKTSDMTSAQLKKLGESSFDAANKFGATVQGYLSGVQEFSRAGYYGDQAQQLAELSILAQSAGDMTAELANDYLIATNAAYGLEGNVQKLNAVLDSQNQVTNRNAVNMSELAEATKVAGSQAAQSGVSIEQMTAATSTMIATTKQGGDVAGRAFKAILMNLQQVSGKDILLSLKQDYLAPYVQKCA